MVVLYRKWLTVSVFSLQPGRGRARVSHAVVVIFLEFFAWGLLTMPMLTVSRLILLVKAGSWLFAAILFPPLTSRHRHRTRRLWELTTRFLSFQVLRETFPDHTFLMNGLVQGVKVRRDSITFLQIKTEPQANRTLKGHSRVSSRSGFPVVSVGSSDWSAV